MTQQAHQHPPLWVEPGEPLPDPNNVRPDSSSDGPGTWPEGLIAAGYDLGAKRLVEAYSKGMFPWFSEGQPVLWWSPDPRMVLNTQDFKCRRSLTKSIRQMARSGRYRISLNEAFPAVMDACAEQRAGQEGTWITDSMKQAYCELQAAGAAHSVEIWRQKEPVQASNPADFTAATSTTEELAGGLYGVSLGRMFFGESMFARERDASKIALASLVLLLQRHGMPVIDCQQNTSHLASLGAMEISRNDFLQQISCLVAQRPPDWSIMSIEFPTV